MSTTARKTNTPMALPDNTLTWPLPDGRLVWPSEMTDEQLRKALVYGLRMAAHHFHSESLDALAAAAGGDDGLDYLADVQSESLMNQASDRKALYAHMATIPRYHAVMREARGRAYARQAIEKAAGRHTPR